MKPLPLLSALVGLTALHCSVPPTQLPPASSSPICVMDPAPPRASMYVQNDSQGARCGDGTDYASSTSIAVNDHCYCDDPAVLGNDAGVFDGWAQFQTSGHNACKPDSQLVTGPKFNFANADCPIGYADGYVARGVGLGPPGGDDDDTSAELCPFLGQGPVTGTGPGPTQELRSDATWREHAGALHLEWQWCRQYWGPFSTHVSASDAGAAKDICFKEFGPRPGERLSAVGDWVLDHENIAHSELHETRMWAVVRRDPDCGGVDSECDADGGNGPCGAEFCSPSRAALCRPNDLHILVSGSFADYEPHRDRLAMTVPVPPRVDATGKPVAIVAGREQLHCEVETPLSDNGCGRLDMLVADPVVENGRAAVVLTLRRNPAVDATNAFACSNESCGSGTPSLAQRCAINGNVVSFARDVRCEWTDPVDAWQCDTCACADPAATGAIFEASVLGGADGLDPSNPDVQVQACNAVCGGLISGGAPSARIGACRPPAASRASAHRVARFGFEPPGPIVRVSDVADFAVQLDPTASTVEVGRVDASGAFQRRGFSRVHGDLRINRTTGSLGRSLEFANLSLTVDDFSVSEQVAPGVTVTSKFSSISTFISHRFAARMTSDTTFEIPPGQMGVGVRATVDGRQGGTAPRNDDAISGSFDTANDVFTLNGEQVDAAAGLKLRFSLVGHFINHPPIADPGPDQVVECSSTGGTQVLLNGTRSRDDDALDSISHYQWFEGGAGLSNRDKAQVSLGLGSREFALHVYDSMLASASAKHKVTVADTTPPSLAVSPGEVCYWPPNHAVARLQLGADIRAIATDACSSAINVRILSATSVDSGGDQGSGGTSNDVRWDGDTVCVRSERSGMGEGRHYDVVIEAEDASHNKTQRTVRLVIPHDQRGQGDCLAAAGVDEIDSCL